MPQLAMSRPLARVVDAIKRRTFEARLRRIPVTDRPLVRIGSEWGGWSIPGDSLDASSVCYCVGAGGDISFDLALIERYGATVRSFDPFEIFGRQAMEQADGDPRFSFHEVAIAGKDGPVTMYGRQDDVEGSVSAANIYRTRQAFVKPGRSLPSLMCELGDRQIDLLKLDIEGSEYDVLESINPADLGVRVLCIEFHHTSSATRARAIVDKLSSDFQVVHRSQRSDLTLAQQV